MLSSVCLGAMVGYDQCGSSIARSGVVKRAIICPSCGISAGMLGRLRISMEGKNCDICLSIFSSRVSGFEICD